MFSLPRKKLSLGDGKRFRAPRAPIPSTTPLVKLEGLAGSHCGSQHPFLLSPGVIGRGSAGRRLLRIGIIQDDVVRIRQFARLWKEVKLIGIYSSKVGKHFQGAFCALNLLLGRNACFSLLPCASRHSLLSTASASSQIGDLSNAVDGGTAAAAGIRCLSGAA